MRCARSPARLLPFDPPARLPFRARRLARSRARGRSAALPPRRAAASVPCAELQESLAYYKMYDWPEGIGPPPPTESKPEEEEEDADGLPYGLPFELAPRVTDADRANDVQSMERSLEQVMSLLALRLPRERSPVAPFSPLQ